MSTKTRQSNQATPARVALLRQLALSTIQTSSQTALFFAERLVALDPHKEDSVYWVALALARNDRSNEAIWALRQPVTFIPDPTTTNEQQLGSHSHPRRHAQPKQITRPALECSIRCARLYADQCLVAGRAKEGRDALAKVLVPGTLLAPVPPVTASLDSLDPSPVTAFRDTEPWVYELELARLARKAGESDRAVVGFRKVLEANPWCWEALDGLCVLGHPPDPDQLYPPRPKSHSALPPSAPISPLPTTHLRPLAPHPAPLGPSQTSAVNSAVPIVSHKGRNGVGAGAMGGATGSDGLGLYTPNDAMSGASLGMVTGINKGNADGKRLFTLGAGGIWRKPGLPPPRGGDFIEMSMDDRCVSNNLPNSVSELHMKSMKAEANTIFNSVGVRSSSSFDNSFYPSQHPSTMSYVPPAALQNAHASTSNYLFTPPAISSLTTAPAPGVKRARGQAAAPSHAAPDTEDLKPGRRVVRGVPGVEKRDKIARDSSHGAPTRRSSRLSRDTNHSSNGTTAAASSSSMSISRSQTSRASSVAITTAAANAAPRDKKRSKNGTGPSVLSDAGSDALSPTSHSSSPVPSSPGAGSSNPPALVIDPAVLEAEDYVVGTLRCFGRAAVAAASYEGAKTIEALMALPVEQQRSWRCLIGVGRAHLEMLNYNKAEKAFSQARQAAPHLLESMELYSTLLWHLRLATPLSFLAQDLMSIAPRSPSSWIASGNVFSHLKDHPAALKCFKRAAQLDAECVYAYTLSGHECVELDEWERALGFFREAVRLDPRHYNAWFGLGNVYMQTGKFRLAEYYFRKAVEINPTNASLVCCVGSVLEKLGRRKEALELYERACTLAPESPIARFKRVKMLISLKQYQLAESDLLALKDRAPNEFNVYFLLGKLYKMLDRKAEMLKYFSLAQDLEPRTAALIRETIQRDTKGEMDVDEASELLG
ncbi:anaphase-promoting complex subunit 3, partial [Phenoliferia sp. Uapishka_3]